PAQARLPYQDAGRAAARRTGQPAAREDHPSTWLEPIKSVRPWQTSPARSNRCHTRWLSWWAAEREGEAAYVTPAPPVPGHTAWLPRSCSPGDMAGATMQ